MEFTYDTTLGDLLDHPQAKVLLDKQFPGLTTNPMFGMVKGMTFKMILANPLAAQLGLDKSKIDLLLAEANKFQK